MDSSYDSSSYEKACIPLLKGTEDYFSWSRVMKARLDRLKAWSPIVSDPPVNRGRTKAPITLARFREYSTPNTLWEALEQAYVAPLITEQLRALQNLLSLRRSQYPDIRQYTTAYKTSKFLEKYKNGTQLADPEELYTTLYRLREDPKKDTKKPALTANIMTGKRKRNDTP
ncbi:hypothetical protein EPUS_09157 [Endocarpon pusillum Z07020]|uniref:DUF4219 domain-containing protein n=1 Tax=Endocarpon pusillum (strain Z07020 / HMAS-L-300199) TaxID=1263415 RepID=U1HV02_ENDPU|nr:uncharacterized protein EPUS_09157 [Endocarpon pusillum Z07020]ERF73139.1 hypothetical protein EPUS_09157 [Endocarpon pusillum Z07020]